MKQLVTATARRLGLEVRRYHPRYSEQCVSLGARGPSRGRVLLAYVIEPFLRGPDEPVSTAHTHHGESLAIAETFRDLGYDVDAIDYRNERFVPRHPYAFLVSARTHLETLAAKLNSDCVKIAHLDTAHYAFNNRAAYERVLAFQRRRGSTCRSIRVIEHNRAIECADYGAVLGNHAFTLETYAYAGKRLFALPVPGAVLYPWNEHKDLAAAARRFLWFGSGGFVHKGLDLVLEAFAGLPDCTLTVCGPLEADAEFTRFYARELHQTPNIRALGWVDIAGPDFRAVLADCAALVYPSCAEGQAGAVVTCLHAGLIPVATRESGVDLEPFGLLLEACTVAGIRRAVQRIAATPTEQLRAMARAAWEHARRHHTREAYAAAYRGMLTQILEDVRGRRASAS